VNLSISSARYLSWALRTDFSVIIEVLRCASRSCSYLESASEASEPTIFTVADLLPPAPPPSSRPYTSYSSATIFSRSSTKPFILSSYSRFVLLMTLT